MFRSMLILLACALLACGVNDGSVNSPVRMTADTISGTDRIWDVELNLTRVCCEWSCNCGWCNLGGQGSMGLSEYFDFIVVFDISDYDDSVSSAEIHLWCWFADSVELYAMVNPLIESLLTRMNGESWMVAETVMIRSERRMRRLETAGRLLMANVIMLGMNRLRWVLAVITTRRRLIVH